MTRDDTSSLEIGGGVRIAPDALTIRFSRASGPGGQNVNKVNTRAELWIDLNSIGGLSERAMTRLVVIAKSYLTDAGQIHLSSSAHRSQERNRDAVLEKLRELILRAMVEPKHRRRTKPTAASRRRRLDAKKHRSEQKGQRRGIMDN